MAPAEKKITHTDKKKGWAGSQITIDLTKYRGWIHIVKFALEGSQLSDIDHK